jgi:hypothetical protein
MSSSWHSAKDTLPSASDLALDKEYFKKIFAECQITGTRQRKEINGFPVLPSHSFSPRPLCPLADGRSPPRRLPAPPPPRARRARRLATRPRARPSPATSSIFILYICPLQSSLKDFILYISFLSNNVL